MEAKRPTSQPKPAHGVREMVINLWRDLGEPQVGGDELRKIHRSINQAGDGGDISPAALARILADAGAELKHPEVIEYDARWREAHFEDEAKATQGLSDLVSADPLRLSQAESLIRRLAASRDRLERAGNDQAEREIRALAIAGREVALARANNQLISKAERDVQTEIAQWLRIWLQTPSLFEQWLELRKSSPDFQRKFSGPD